MEYVRLGSTGLKVSSAILGCGNFGGVGSASRHWGSGTAKDEAFAVLDRALELGINCLDTADAYGGGLSEQYIGDWLERQSAEVRDGLIIATKVGQPVGPAPDDRGLSRRHVLKQVDRSLGKLRVDVLDLFLIHHPDPSTPLEETISALDDVVRQGKVRYIGACNMPAWQMAKSLGVSDRGGWHRFAWAQQPYNLLQRDDEREFLPLIADEGLGYTPHSPLAGGWLTGKYSAGSDYPSDSRMAHRPELYPFVDDSLHARLDDLREFAEQRGCTMGALSLAWVMSHPLVTAPLLGPRRAGHLDLLEEALGLSLSTDEREEIAALVAPRAPRKTTTDHT